jgi:hypothetical protein
MSKERAKRARKPVSEMAVEIAKFGEAEGNFLERRDPAKAVKALEMLAEGCSFGKIREELGMKWETISRLKARHQMVLEDRRRELAQDALEIAEGLRLLQKEKMRQLAEDPEQLARTNIRDLAIPWGISMDKYMAVIGENKVVVEHKAAAPSLEDAMKAIAEARAKLQQSSIDIPAVSVEPKPVEPAKD